jgi:hypothetical protein
MQRSIDFVHQLNAKTKNCDCRKKVGQVEPAPWPHFEEPCHEIDDFAAQGTSDTLSITVDGFACILSCLLIAYSGGLTCFEEPRDEIKWAQLHGTRDA